MKLTKKEEAWLLRLEKCLASAPVSLNKKVQAYTIGDNDITLYDLEKQTEYEDKLHERDTPDKGVMVYEAGTYLNNFVFPFGIESTAG